MSKRKSQRHLVFSKRKKLLDPARCLWQIRSTILALAILRKIGAIGSKFAPDPPRGNFNQPNQGGRSMKVLFSTIAMAALLGASATRAQDPVIRRRR
jgi:hypothetical protein